MKIIRKSILCIFVMIISILLFSCVKSNTNNDSNYSIVDSTTEFVVGERFSMSNYVNNYFVYYESSDDSIVSFNGLTGTCNSVGACFIYSKTKTMGSVVKTYFINVIENKAINITLTGANIIEVNEETQLDVTISPSKVSLNKISFQSSDEAIATVTNTGIVKGVSTGLVSIRAFSNDDNTVYDELVIFVTDNNVTIDSLKETIIEGTSETIDISNGTNALSSIISKNSQYIVGVKGYIYSGRNPQLVEMQSGTGVIYKRTYILDDDTEVEKIERGQEFKCYKYYVITNKHIINNMDEAKIVYNSKKIDAFIIASDTKIDIGVISFMDTNYIPICEFGDSDTVETGDFVLAIGNALSDDDVTTASFGIVSYNVRYVATDTDSDNVNDWDALYIQHDAAVTNESSGGALINLEGKVIGINSIKISAKAVDNMAFSIPINTVINLVSMLEQGIVPTRPLLGVSIIMVKDIINNGTTGVTIPNDVKYGAYVAEVTTGGVASKAGVQVGDIILEFNGIKIYYSYEIRAALNDVIIGSGDDVILTVYRNGEIIELKAVF